MFGKTRMTGLLVAAVVAASVTSARAGPVNFAMVTVGDPGNVADTTQHSGGDYPTGAVDYTYQIGAYDVTNNQYAAFLNAVATGGDPYGLWNGNMQNDANSGIDRTGSGPYSYAVKPFQGNQPVVDVSFYDAVRFVNWLSNGQPTGAEGNGTTESGTYLITGGGNDSGTVTIPTAVQRAAWAAGGSGVHWLLPSEDEWYKAAYYVGGGTNAGYWTYATRSNTAPTSQAPPGGANSANFDGPAGFALTQSAIYSATTDYLTNVGAYSNTVSPYGAFDMGGDVWQWNEADINGDGTTRGIRGGSFDNDAVRLASTYDTDIGYAADEFDDTGFRIASVGAAPEPASLVLLLAGGFSLFALAWRRRRSDLPVHRVRF
jgi:formylglycine-generating enzyme required for sulfatase activity